MGEAHTPGPWKLWTSNSWRRFHGPDGPICEPITQKDGHPDLHFRNGGPDGPDARLIAAAPDLLEALKTVLHWRHPHEDVLTVTDGSRRAIAAARAAIALAEGRKREEV